MSKDRGAAVAWLRDQVGSGPRVRAAPLPAIDGGRLRWVAGERPADEGPDPGAAAGVGQEASDRGLVRLLSARVALAPFVLVVEDDLADPGGADVSAGRPDRKVIDRDDAATIDGFVLHWRLVEPATVEGVPDFLRTSASGYPTVAYTAPARLAARMRAKTWEQRLAEELAREATAIIVSAFDDEGWLVWERPIA